MQIASLQFNPIQEMTYILWDDSLECVIIDAGNSTPKENTALFNFISERGLKPVMVIATHGHFDHNLGTVSLCEHYGIPFAMSAKDQFLLDGASTSGSIFGIEVGALPKKVDIDLDGIKELTFGNSTLQVIPTPGHTPGHVVLFNDATRTLFTGDTLFRESIGRTDLPGGDYSWIMRSIIDSIIPLGEDVRIYPGHGADSTISHEMLYNPFIVEVLNDEVNYRD